MKFVPGLLVRPASPPHLPLTTPGLSITPDRLRAGPEVEMNYLSRVICMVLLKPLALRIQR